MAIIILMKSVFLILQLQQLNLSNNRLQHLSSYVQLPMKCAKLTTLDLSNNEIRDVGELEHIKDMSTIINLRLLDNPLSKNSQDFGGLCSAVRKYFPNLQFLVSGCGRLGNLTSGT